MLRLFYSNRLEDLIPPLAESVREQQARDPLEPVTIVVPGRVMEQYLKFELAERLGVAANLRFPFLGGYLADLVRRADPGLRVVERSELQLALLERLRAPGVLDTDDLGPVRRYIDATGPDSARRTLRAFQLAGQLARLFHEYAFSRRGWFAATPDGPLFPAGGATARWQRAMWRLIFDERGALRAGRDKGETWMLLPDAFDSAPPGARKTPDTLHVFGLPHMAPAMAGMVGALARNADLRLYALHPCREPQEGGGDSAASNDPEGPGGNRGLRLWARPAREYIRLLHDQCDAVSEPLFVAAPGEARGTLLDAIRTDILLRAPERPLVDGVDRIADDGSIRFLACPGLRREVEVVANTIWTLLDGCADGRVDGPLRFHEIAVVVPDRLMDAYLPHIETVFGSLHRIPINPIKGRLAGESHIAEAVDLLLRLPLSRFERLDLIRLLTHPAVGGAEPEADMALWRGWCDALHVLFGADRSEFEGTYIRKDIYNWDQALRRLALGTFMAGGRSGEEAAFAGTGDPCLPMEVSQGAITSAGRFVRTARTLIENARDFRAADRPLAQWADVLARMVSATIAAADDRDRRVLDRCLDAIAAIGAVGIDVGPVPYALAHEMVAQAVAGIEAERGHLARSGVAVGPLSALCGVPFRVVFAVGLDEGVFPARDREDAMDLRAEGRVAGEVSPRDRDRHLFLDLLLSARERIFLSYVSRNAQTGDPLEPSTAIRELQLVLREHVSETALEAMTVPHPVSRYEPKNFPALGQGRIREGDPFASVDHEARRGARVGMLRQDLRRHLGPDAPLPGGDDVLRHLSTGARPRIDALLRRPEPPPAREGARREGATVDLSLSALRRFLECPLQGYARYALGLVDEDPEDAEDHEEPVSQSQLDRTMLLREAFWEGNGDPGRAAGAYRRILSARELEGAAPTEAFARSEERLGAEILGAWSANLARAGISDLSRWRIQRLGRADEFADADDLGEPLVLPVRVGPSGAEQVVTVRIHGSTERHSLEASASLLGVIREKPKDKDYLGQFLSFVVLAAQGHRLRPFTLHAVPTEDTDPDKWRRGFKAFSPKDARDYLGGLVADLLSGPHDYFLPVEAVYAADKARGERSGKGTKDPVEEVEAIRDNENTSCCSDYGPVRDARDYDPPDEEKLDTILRRRFGLLLDGHLKKPEVPRKARADSEPEVPRKARADSGEE